MSVPIVKYYRMLDFSVSAQGVAVKQVCVSCPPAGRKDRWAEAAPCEDSKLIWLLWDIRNQRGHSIPLANGLVVGLKPRSGQNLDPGAPLPGWPEWLVRNSDKLGDGGKFAPGQEGEALPGASI